MAPKFGTGRPAFPGLTGKLVFDTFRGKQRVRKWPRKRGKPTSSQVRIQNDRFAAAQRLATSAPGSVMNKAISATLNTGLYPRDLLTQLILNGPIDLELPDGTLVQHGRRELFAVMFQGFELRLTGNQFIPSSVVTPVIWPSPIIDTAGVFDAAEPDRITVPEGVTVMTFTAGYRITTQYSGAQLIEITRLSGVIEDKATSALSGARDVIVTTGPISVLAGEQYAAQIYFTVGRTLLPPATFFTGQILGAEPV